MSDAPPPLADGSASSPPPPPPQAAATAAPVVTPAAAATPVVPAAAPAAAAATAPLIPTGHSRESSEFEFLSEAASACSSVGSNVSATAAAAAAATIQPAAAASTKRSPSQDSVSGGGLLGWMKAGISGGGLLSKVQSSMETVITTLDPQMKEYIRSGGQGDPCVVVASDKAVKVDPVRKAFQQVFGRATVFGVPAQGSTIADQPVGFAAGRQAAQERINYVKSRDKDPDEFVVVVSIEGFLLEVNDDEWVSIECLALNDDKNGVSLNAYTQPTTVDPLYVDALKDATPESYPKRWSGFAKTIGQAIEELAESADRSAGGRKAASAVYPTRKDWHAVLGGIPRSELIGMACVSLAYQYQRTLAAKFGPEQSGGDGDASQ